MDASWQQKGKGAKYKQLCNSPIEKVANVVLNHFAYLLYGSFLSHSFIPTVKMSSNSVPLCTLCKYSCGTERISSILTNDRAPTPKSEVLKEKTSKFWTLHEKLLSFEKFPAFQGSLAVNGSSLQIYGCICIFSICKY